jgi:hypothetical protein
MTDEADKEGYSYMLEDLVNYLKTAPKGVIAFWVIMLILLLYSFHRAWDYLSFLF